MVPQTQGICRLEERRDTNTYIYCHYKLKEEQTIARLLPSLLKQLLRQDYSVPDQLLKSTS